jgi:prephenate dehydrogenase
MQAKLSNTEIVGSTGNSSDLKVASKMGVADSTTPRLRDALDGAQLVILDLPAPEIKELLDVVGTTLDEGCIVTDTAATKAPVIEWAEEYLPRGVDFIGGHPLLKKHTQSVEEADAALFKDAHYCVIPARSASKKSVSTVVNLVERIGSKPLFLDAHEHDSYAAAMAFLPLVVSSAFVTATTGSESWKEMHRLAASEFAGVSSLANNDPEDSEAACLANPDVLVHWVDQVITELYAFRNRIKDKSEDLLEPFVQAWEARAKWEVGAMEDEGRKRHDLPTASESMATALVGTRLVERYRDITGSNKKKKQAWEYIRKR